ncbi:MAG: LCP family protein [Actinomycetaceae bacterium]|nr:LCP family protein [Actinomycetaceae bacterium]
MSQQQTRRGPQTRPQGRRQVPTQTATSRQQVAPPPGQPDRGVARKRRKRRGLPIAIAAFLVLAIAWPFILLSWASGKIEHVDALSGRPDTPGTTYLLAGSDSRAGTDIYDDTEGHRSDTIMMLHHAPNGSAYLISLPRDSWVYIPEYGEGKINASYAYGGAPLLTQTVEELSGLTIDHYVEVGMSGVVDVVDAVGGVELCLDYDVNDERSELVWDAGCHVADGTTALAFARMRYADPNGDIGRAERQRQVISAITKTVAKPGNALNPVKQMKISAAGAESVTADHDTSATDLAWLAWYFRKATSAGNTGTPPIASLNLETYQGSAVLLDEDLTPVFFQKLASGTLTSADLKANDLP